MIISTGHNLRNLQRQSRAVCQARAPRMNEGVWLAVVGVQLPKALFLDHVIAEADPRASVWANSFRALRGTSGGSLSHGGL